jgi:hypothetical protein
MYELEQNVFDGSRAVMETLRVSQYDLVLFNMDTQRSISFIIAVTGASHLRTLSSAILSINRKGEVL